jgi:hypothetical protein
LISSKTADAFLALVRLGIGHGYSGFPDDVDWPAIKALADQHGLSAVILDGIDKLNTNRTNLTNGLPLELKLEWIGEVLQEYEQRYELYCRTIAELAGWHNAQGLKMMVLKGYACALNWPRPEHRPCGDIDIWQFGQQKEADALMEKEKGIRIDSAHHHHTVYYWRDFMVENHYDFLNVHHHKSNVSLEAILKELGQDHSHSIEVLGEKVYLPSPNLHALFLLRHSMSNFASTRIQIRQLLDWAFFVKANHQDIDRIWLEDVLEKYGMKRLYDVFNAICVGDLGFDVKIFSKVQFDPQLKEKVLKEILYPEITKKTPKSILLRIPFKYRRWRANEWKHRLCFNDSMISAFWSGVKSHLLKPSSI